MAINKVKLFFIDDEVRANLFSPWVNDVGYSNVPSFATGSNGIVYRSTAANGVDESGTNIGAGPIDPVTDVTGVWEEFATEGATGGGRNRVFFENEQNVTDDYTITAGRNAMTAGPVTVNDGVTVTVPDGSEWSVV